MLSPKAEGFSCGLHGKPRDSYPKQYDDVKMRQFLEGWHDGTAEANARRDEAKRIVKVGYKPETVAVKVSGRVVVMTFEQYRKRIGGR